MPKHDGKKGENNIEKVNTYSADVKETYTALQLLGSTEDKIVCLSICTLDTFVSKYGKVGLSYLQEKDLLGKLFNNLERVKITRTMCLKLLVNLIQLEGIMSKIQTNLDYPKILLAIFMTTEDPIELEYTTYLLSRICVIINCAELLCQNNIIDNLFETIVTQNDLDVKNNCLELIFRLVNCHQMRQMLSETPSFRVKVLNLVLQGPFFVLRPITVEILAVISYWEFDKMQDQLYQNETISYLFDILAEEKWTNVQNIALTTIYNCLKFHPVQVKGIESKNFLKFVNYARNSDSEHALACIALIEAFVAVKENLQVLFGQRVHEILSDFCKYDDDLIYIKFCNTVTEFCKNCHTVKELATPVVVKEIERLMRKTNLSWIPYRQAGLQPLYLFLMNNPRLGMLFYQTNILKHILCALQHRDEIDTLYYKMSLEMFQSLLGSRCFHKYMWNSEIYSNIVSLLKDYDTQFVVIAMDIIQRTFYSQEYREWFLEFDGVEYVARMLSTRDCDFIEQAITFCKVATKYNDICIGFLKSGLIPVIQDLGANSAHKKQICDAIVDDIYKCELSIKFHDTWFLNYHDITKNGFCIYVGYKPRSFPPDVVETLEMLTYASTMITVNFHGKRRELLPVAVGQRYEHADENAYPEDGGVSVDMSEVKTDVMAEIKTGLKPKDKPEEKLIFKLILPVPDKDPTTDYYLKTYLKDAQRLINNEENDTMTKKIIVLGKFVMAQLSGYNGSLPTKLQYETHILELKKKLLSNYIPLGYIRLGGIVERALLFKVLADRLGIPATFRRTSDFFAWNEVVIYNNSPNYLHNFRYNCIQHYVVDLMDDPGTLLMLGQKKTKFYYNKLQKYAHLFETDSTSTFALTSSNTDSYA